MCVWGGERDFLSEEASLQRERKFILRDVEHKLDALVLRLILDIDVLLSVCLRCFAVVAVTVFYSPCKGDNFILHTQII